MIVTIFKYSTYLEQENNTLKIPKVNRIWIHVIPVAQAAIFVLCCRMKLKTRLSSPLIKISIHLHPIKRLINRNKLQTWNTWVSYWNLNWACLHFWYVNDMIKFHSRSQERHIRPVFIIFSVLFDTATAACQYLHPNTNVCIAFGSSLQVLEGFLWSRKSLQEDKAHIGVFQDLPSTNPRSRVRTMNMNVRRD